MNPFIIKYHKLILILILLTGFLLRFQAARITPINWDEEDELASAQRIFETDNALSVQNIQRNLDTGPIGTKILMVFGRNLFSKSLLGTRLPFIICGTAIILLLYFFVKYTFNLPTALLAAFLLAISQFDVGMTRYADPNSFLVFFTLTSLFLFYKAINENKQKLLLLSAVSVGTGFWFKESAASLLVVYFIFLATHPKYRNWLKNKYIWLSLLLTIALITPNIFLVLSPQNTRSEYLENAIRIGLSFNSSAVYLGELLLLILKHLPSQHLYREIIPSLDPQFPMVNFTFGLVIITAIFRSIRDKTPAVRLLIIYFLINFIPFMFLRGGIEEIDSFWCLSNLDWSILNFVPGIILTAKFIIDTIPQRKGILFLTIITVGYMIVRTMHMVNFPISYCYPAMNHSINIQLNVRVMHFLEKGDKKAAQTLLEKIYRVSDNYPRHKKNAALKLAKMAMQENKPLEAEPYIYYLLSLNAEDPQATELLNEL